MPLVDITNDIKRSRLKQRQLGEEKEEKKSSSVLKPIPSTLRRISISKKSSLKDDSKEGEEEEEQRTEQQPPPTRSKRDSLSGSGSSPFSKVSVEQPGEFLESEPSLSQSDCLSSNTKDEEEEEEQQNVLVQQKNQQQQQLRQSRRQKHQPQRLGDLLEWNDIKSNALYEKYDPEKAHREQQMKLLTNTNTTNTNNSNRVMEEEEEKRSKASDYQSGQNSKAVLEVHQRVADLMKLAEQMLPPEEEEADDDGLPKKSIREKLRDAWDGDGYYAKLMKEQDYGPSSSSSRTSSTPPTSNGNSKSKTNNNGVKKEGLKVYCDKENPVTHKVNRGAKKASGLGGGLSSSGGGGKLAVGCGNTHATGGGLANHAPKPLVQRTALTSALGNVTNASSSSSSNNVNATVSGSAYMFGNLKSIQAPSATQNSSSSNASEKPTNSTPPSSSSSSSLSSSSSSSFASASINTDKTKKETNTNNETLLNALKAENDLLRKQRNDVKLTHLKLKKELDDLKRNARIAVSKLCAKLPNNSRGVELDALAFLKLSS